MSNIAEREQAHEALIKSRNLAKEHPGFKLSNGGLILAQSKWDERNDGSLMADVLAFVPESTWQPFVIWTRCVGVERRADGSYGPLDYCFSGDYHRSLESALVAWKKVTA